MWLPILSETSGQGCSRLLIFTTLVSSVPIPGSRGRYCFSAKSEGAAPRNGMPVTDGLAPRELGQSVG